MPCVVSIAGDGIGPQIMAATQSVVDAASRGQIEWVVAEAGLRSHQSGEEVLPQRTLQLLHAHKVALCGPLVTPVESGYASVSLGLRKLFDLHTCLRPVFHLPGVPGSRELLDLVVVSEGTEGLLDPSEWQDETQVKLSARFTPTAFAKTVRAAIELARTRRKRLTLVLMDQAFRQSMGVYRRVFEDVTRAEASDLKVDALQIGAASAQMARWPGSFDVIVTEQMLGEILSDHGATLMGGMGLVPSISLGESCAVFSTVHGSALDIAQETIANPSALMFAAAHMLEHLGQTVAAHRLRHALKSTLNGHLTRDLGGFLNTQQFTRAVLDKF